MESIPFFKYPLNDKYLIKGGLLLKDYVLVEKSITLNYFSIKARI
jgi:hypothetical protein